MVLQPRLRADLSTLPRYVPGRAAVGDPEFKLSSNELPYEPLPSVREAVRRELGQFHRYPDPGSTELVAALADRLGVPAEHIVPGTGSVAVTHHLVRAAAGEGDEVLFAWRSFEAYPLITWAAGARAVQVPLAGESHDLDAMAAAVTDRTRVIFVCNPNNPTGTPVRRDDLDRFLDRVPRDVLVVLDEAYREFVTDPDVPDGIEVHLSRPNVAVLRTFSKAYGLARLRVGYAVAHPPVAAALRACAIPFGVSGPAQSAALASLRAESELRERVERVVRERDRVTAELRTSGWQVPGSEANFVWLRLGERTEAFTAACEDAGLMVRPYPDEGVRVTIGTPAANDRFLKVAHDWNV
ncbi:histidinol-phosphate transaminase [Streptomyces sp. Ru71]|uniref:histidinol-phosphate transaminase n=1 Tax=Streptomyces sp. Ru71 TaxID=2080746 RepID=UPI000CDCF7F2|nr:histidinol-phosphate transaminase [Streptomyces sp. Ru71]POX56976.1 histidinol-phosphate transaminase [Streptomyces sp. Ru71]